LWVKIDVLESRVVMPPALSAFCALTVTVVQQLVRVECISSVPAIPPTNDPIGVFALVNVPVV
jgi:hypothetical protein